jgi:hypothetical protein
MKQGIEWRRFVRFIGITAGFAALTVLAVAFARDKINSARQAELVEQLKSEMVFDLEGLAGRLTEVQTELMPILPPEPTLRIHQPVGMFAFDPAGFPKDFLAGLVYDIEHGCPVYTVTVQEDSLTGEILFYNGDDKPISSLPPVKDYDVWWLFEYFHPTLYTRQPTA